MLFKHCIKEVNGLSFVYEHLQLCSSIGKSRLLNQPFLTGENEIENELKKVEHFILFQKNNPTRAGFYFNSYMGGRFYYFH